MCLQVAKLELLGLDFVPQLSAATLEVLDTDGPGMIRHIWFTIASPDPTYPRSLVLRMYWDNETQPAVESPIPFVPFLEMLPIVDILSLHLPLTAETTAMIDAAAIDADFASP